MAAARLCFRIRAEYWNGEKGALPVGSDDSDGVGRGAVAAGDVLLAGGAGVGEEGLGGQGRRRGRGAAGGDVQDAAADAGVLGRRDLVGARAQQLGARVLLQVPRQVRLEHAELLLLLLVVVGSGGGRHLGLRVAAAAPAAAPAAAVAGGGGHGGGAPVGGAASHVRRRGVRGLLREASLEALRAFTGGPYSLRRFRSWRRRCVREGRSVCAGESVIGFPR